MPKKKKKTKGNRDKTGYAHNPRYCMIAPDAARPDEDDVTPTGQS